MSEQVIVLFALAKIKNAAHDRSLTSREKKLPCLSIVSFLGKILLCLNGVHVTLSQSHRVDILASHPEAPGWILGISKNFSLDVA